jgi:hypothetical protein
VKQPDGLSAHLDIGVTDAGRVHRSEDAICADLA